MAAELLPLPSLQQQLAEVEAEAQDWGRSPLVQAAATGRHDVLTHLLRGLGGGGGGGSDSEGGDSLWDREDALLAAAEHGHVRCLRALLEASPRPVVAELVPARDGCGQR